MHSTLGKQYINKILLEKEISQIPSWVLEIKQFNLALCLGRGGPRASAPYPTVGSTGKAGGWCVYTQQGSGRYLGSTGPGCRKF